jgi:hypothetical protein
MPIQATCPSCKKTIRVGDQHAGKKARCPHCQGVVEIPAATAGGSATGAATWHVQTPEDRFGPITKAELDQWAKERRIDQDCQIWCEGWPEWKFAPEVYPHLAQAAAQTTAPTTAPTFGGVNLGGPPALPGAGFPAINTGASAPGYGSAPAYGGPYASPQTSSYGGGGDDASSPATRRILNACKAWLLMAAIAGFVCGALFLFDGIDWFSTAGDIGESIDKLEELNKGGGGFGGFGGFGGSVNEKLLGIMRSAMWTYYFRALSSLALTSMFIGGSVFLLMLFVRAGTFVRGGTRIAAVLNSLKGYITYVAISLMAATLFFGIAKIIEVTNDDLKEMSSGMSGLF